MRLQKFNLKVEPSKTQILRFSRFHPGMERRFSFLGFEFYWFIDRKGTPRVMRRTARNISCKSAPHISQGLDIPSRIISGVGEHVVGDKAI